jgi:anthranilate phosphoribosyltransferase
MTSDPQDEFRALIDAAARRNLTELEARRAMALMSEGGVDAAAIREFLLTPAMSLEGVDAPALTGLAREVIARVTPSPGIEAAVRFDTCGTGGGASTFNVSTATAFVLAAAVRRDARPDLASASVCKHGNRAVASRCGSADVLEELGVAIDLPPAANVRLLNRTGFAFFFAPKYHGAFAHVGPVRRALAAEGKRTAFNLIGPVANPAGVTHQVVGVFSPERIGVVADTLRALGIQGALVVSGKLPGGGILDEIALEGETAAVEIRGGETREFTLTASDFGLSGFPLGILGAVDRAESAMIVRDVVEGRETKSPREAAVVANAAAALHIADRGTFAECAALAAEAIASGDAARLLDRVTAESRPHAA